MPMKSVERTDGPSRSITSANANLNIVDLFSAVAARWRLFFVALACSLGLAGLYIVVMPARYAATMSFLVDTRDRPPIGVDAAPIPQSADSGLIENQMRLLTSNTVLRRVVDDENLSSDPDFNARQPAESLAKAITVKRSDKSYVIDVEVRSSSAEKAERLAKALAKAFLDTQKQFSDAVADKEVKWLDDKIEDLRKRLETAENRIQDYRQTHQIVVAEGLTPPEQQLRTADAAVVAARGKRAEIEARYQQMANFGKTAANDVAAESFGSPLLDKLRGDYSTLTREAAAIQSTLGPRHPSVILIQTQIAAQRSQIAREIKNIQDTQRRELLSAREIERAAEAQVVELKKSINDAGETHLELVEMERLAAALRDNYKKSLVARENTRARIITSPNPVLINQVIAQSARISPKTTPALLIAIAGALNLWIAAALILENLARRRAAAARKPVLETEAAFEPQRVEESAWPAIETMDAFKGRRLDDAARPIVESEVKAKAQLEPQNFEDAAWPVLEAENKAETEFELEARWQENMSRAAVEFESRLEDGPAESAPRADLDSIAAFEAFEAFEASLTLPLPALDDIQDDADANRNCEHAILSRALEAMESKANPYRRAIIRLRNHLRRRYGILSPTPVVAVIALTETAGATTLALALALQARDRGERVLAIDCNENHPTLAQLSAYLTPVHMSGDGRLKIFACQQDPYGGGQILFTRIKRGDPPPDKNFLNQNFDLVLLDCGASGAPNIAIDAMIMVQKDRFDDRRQAHVSYHAQRAAA